MRPVRDAEAEDSLYMENQALSSTEIRGPPYNTELGPINTMEDEINIKETNTLEQ